MYKKILVPLDGSELAECVLPHVEAIAKGCAVKDVVLVRVVEPAMLAFGGADEDNFINAEMWTRIESEHKAAAQKYLDQLVSQLNLAKDNVRTEVLYGGPADSIANYATENKVDLIAIATHGRSGIGRWVIGSVADRILRSAGVPVLMVRAPGCNLGI